MKPVGSRVTMTVSWWGGHALPTEGDFLRTSTGRCYRIDEVRMKGERGALICTVLERDAVAASDPGVFLWAWAPRRRVAPRR